MNKILKTISVMFLFPLLVSEETEIQKPSTGDIWQLETRSSRLSNYSGDVLYYLPNDAYNTYRARKFNEWEDFTVVDSRDIETLSTRYKIQLLKTGLLNK